MRVMCVLKITDFFKFSNGQTVLIGVPDPKPHKLITSDYAGEIIVKDTLKRFFNIMGQDTFVRTKITEKNQQTFIRTKDNIDDIIEYLGKKEITANIYYRD